MLTAEQADRYRENYAEQMAAHERRFAAGSM